jgi:hypothetical protein
MNYHVFVESQPDRGFVATVLGWPDCVGVGPTKEEAVASVRAVIADRLARGEIVRVQVAESVSADPWERLIGQFVDDPHWDEFQEELTRLREEANRA